MSRGKWSPLIIVRYLLFQLPGTLLLSGFVLVSYRVDFIPPHLAWSLWALWIVKDVVLYPLVWKAYDPAGRKYRSPMTGKTGVAGERLDPRGYVSVSGELWKAEAEDGFSPIEEGTEVVVSRVEGLTLTVRPKGP